MCKIVKYVPVSPSISDPGIRDESDQSPMLDTRAFCNENGVRCLLPVLAKHLLLLQHLPQVQCIPQRDLHSLDKSDHPAQGFHTSLLQMLLNGVTLP